MIVLVGDGMAAMKLCLLEPAILFAGTNLCFCYITKDYVVEISCIQRIFLLHPSLFFAGTSTSIRKENATTGDGCFLRPATATVAIFCYNRVKILLLPSVFFATSIHEAVVLFYD